MTQALILLAVILSHALTAGGQGPAPTGEARFRMKEISRLGADRTGVRGVRAAVPGPAGELLVIDGQGRLHHFSAGGDHRAIVLGGEAARTMALRAGRQGRQWWVLETRTAVTHWFDSRGQLLHADAPLAIDSAAYATWSPLGFPDGWTALMLATRRDGLHEIISVRSGTTAVAKPLYRVSTADQRIWVRTPDGLSTVVPVPFAGSAVWQVDPSANYLGVVTQNGKDGFAQIEIRSLGGTTLYRARQAYEPEFLSTNEIKQAIEREVSSRGEKWRQETRRMLDSATRGLRRVKQGVLEVLVGSDGSAWIRADSPSGKHQWTVFSPKGERLGSITVPSYVAVRAVEPRQVWASEARLDGLTDLVRYSLHLEVPAPGRP